MTMTSEIKDASEKVQAGAKAAANKIRHPDKDADNEYTKEKIKERLD
jgi:hypothetical protein